MRNTLLTKILVTIELSIFINHLSADFTRKESTFQLKLYGLQRLTGQT